MKGKGHPRGRSKNTTHLIFMSQTQFGCFLNQDVNWYF